MAKRDVYGLSGATTKIGYPPTNPAGKQPFSSADETTNRDARSTGARAKKQARSNNNLHRLTIERLEARMMFALDVIETDINGLLSTAQQPSIPMVFSANQAPTFTTSATVVGGPTVSGNSAMLIARAIDDDSDSLLRYTWRMTDGPENATLRFSANGSNAARTTTVTFNRAGQYTFEVTARDGGGLNATSTVDINVEQVHSGIRVINSRGNNLVSNRAFTVGTTSDVFIAVGIDQFNQPMSQQSDVVWTNPIKPAGSAVDLETSGNQVAVTFDRAGTFGLRAVIENRSFNVSLSVTPKLTSLLVTQSDGTEIESDAPLDIAATRMDAFVRGIDQFGNLMNTVPKFNVTTVEAPQSGRISPIITGSNLTMAFNKLGQYDIRIAVGNLTKTVSINIIPTMSGLLVSTSQNNSVAASSAMTVATASQTLQVIARDQYGAPLKQQPAFTWQTVVSPSGSQPTLDASGNNVTIIFDRAGNYTFRAVGGGRTFDAKLSVKPTLTTIELLTPENTAISTSPVDVASRTQRVVIRGYDQFGNVLANLPKISSATTSSPANGRAVVSLSGSNATITFNRAGEYSVSFRNGNRIASATFNVIQTFTRATITDSQNRNLGSSTATAGANVSLGLKAMDQFGIVMTTQPNFTWTTTNAPTGSDVSFEAKNGQTLITFDRSGVYGFRATADSISSNISVRVLQTLTDVSITPGGANIARGTAQQFRISATDQFGNDIGSGLSASWSATGGRITGAGVYTAGNTLGNFRITARIGARSYSAPIAVVANQTQDTLQDSTLAELTQSFYVDGQISRTEMMELIRTTIEDGTINSEELSDLRFLTSSQTNFQMPAHVRELAKSVVTSNPANLQYRGQALGNLIAGSSAAHVNNLIDKWFLGTDDPILVGTGISYRNATGSLFVGTPTISQARQGALGDCYFIASMISIASKNPAAVQNMFIDNGDDTYTVKFYGGALGTFYQNGLISSGFISGSGVASYVTVNLRLPTYGNGTLAYSGMGLSATSSNTPLWIALAEKAYAQWNELGNSGRDGKNQYSSIEGGWMSNTNSQILGYNSTNYPMSGTSKQTLINALNSGNAVTIGTNSSVNAGLVGGHAYVVTGYNASTDRFTLFNPWGNTHPSPLTWQQLQLNCSTFVVTNPNGSVSGGAGISYSEFSNEILAGVGVLDAQADVGDQAEQRGDNATLALIAPVTEYVSCGYDVSSAFSTTAHNPTDLDTLSPTSESHDVVFNDSALVLELLLLEPCMST